MENKIIKFKKYPSILYEFYNQNLPLLFKTLSLRVVKVNNFYYSCYKNKFEGIEDFDISEDFDFSNLGLCILNMKSNDVYLRLLCREVIENDNEIIKE